MSDDEQNSWFAAESSNSAEERDARDLERRLEAVPGNDEGSEGPDDWFREGSDVSAPVVERSPADGDRRSTMLFVGVVCAVLVVIAGGALGIATLVGGEESSSGAAPLAAPPVADEQAKSAAGGGGLCESSSETVTVGDGEGDTDSVAGVVLAFQYAYYVERDAEQMAPLLAEDSTITDLDALQEGIDSVPRGTSHCVRVTPGDEGTAVVEVTETAPDDTETIYHQRVSTTREGGEVRIVSIEDGE